MRKKNFFGELTLKPALKSYPKAQIGNCELSRIEGNVKNFQGTGELNNFFKERVGKEINYRNICILRGLR